MVRTQILRTFLTMLLAGIYMAWIEPTKTPGKVFPFVRNVVGVIFFVMAVLTASGGIRDYLDGQVNARIQGMGAAGGAKPGHYWRDVRASIDQVPRWAWATIAVAFGAFGYMAYRTDKKRGR